MAKELIFNNSDHGIESCWDSDGKCRMSMSDDVTSPTDSDPDWEPVRRWRLLDFEEERRFGGCKFSCSGYLHNICIYFFTQPPSHVSLYHRRRINWKKGGIFHSRQAFSILDFNSEIFKLLLKSKVNEVNLLRVLWRWRRWPLRRCHWWVMAQLRGGASTATCRRS